MPPWPRVVPRRLAGRVNRLNRRHRVVIVPDPMHLTEILKPDFIRVPLEATAKQAVIFELVDLLAEKVGLTDSQPLRDAVWSREMTRTTGIGHGLAIPHGKLTGLGGLCMAMGVAREPIEFGAIDGCPVELVMLLASPIDQTGPHIQALAQISKVMTDAAFRNQLKTAESAEGLYATLQAWEQQG